jgi:hypothetical protein
VPRCSAGWSAYAVATASIVFLVLLRAAPNFLVAQQPLVWILLLGLVSAAAAYRCGPGPGVAATALAAIYSAWAFVLPLHLTVASVERGIALGLLILAGFVGAILSPAR